MLRQTHCGGYGDIGEVLAVTLSNSPLHYYVTAWIRECWYRLYCGESALFSEEHGD